MSKIAFDIPKIDNKIEYKGKYIMELTDKELREALTKCVEILRDTRQELYEYREAERNKPMQQGRYESRESFMGGGL